MLAYFRSRADLQQLDVRQHIQKARIDVLIVVAALTTLAALGQELVMTLWSVLSLRCPEVAKLAGSATVTLRKPLRADGGAAYETSTCPGRAPAQVALLPGQLYIAARRDRRRSRASCDACRASDGRGG